MSGKKDVFKSLVRSAASRAGRSLGKLGPVSRVRDAMKQIATRGTGTIGADALGTAIAHAPGVASSGVVIRDGKIAIEAAFDDGQRRSFSLLPGGARFAPRGAKELRLLVEPTELARDIRVQSIAGAVASRVAQTMWGMVLRGDYTKAGTIVDRDDAVLRIDLRTVPAVRAAQSKGAIALVMDSIELRDLVIDGDNLSLDVKLPDAMF